MANEYQSLSLGIASPYTGGANSRSGYSSLSPSGTPQVPTAKPNQADAGAVELKPLGLLGFEQLLRGIQLDPDMSTAVSDQVTYLRHELEAVQGELAADKAEREWFVSDALSQPAASFILTKILEADEEGVTLGTLAANLLAPGWLAFAMLWRANLIERHGTVIIPTTKGKELAPLLLNG